MHLPLRALSSAHVSSVKTTRQLPCLFYLSYVYHFLKIYLMQSLPVLCGGDVLLQSCGHVLKHIQRAMSPVLRLVSVCSFLRGYR